jgi:hypothetical protein
MAHHFLILPAPLLFRGRHSIPHVLSGRMCIYLRRFLHSRRIISLSPPAGTLLALSGPPVGDWIAFLINGFYPSRHLQLSTYRHCLTPDTLQNHAETPIYIHRNGQLLRLNAEN